LDANLIEELAFQATGDLAPVNSIVGGFVAHHALNALSGNVQTTGQHAYFSFIDCLPSIVPSEDDVQPAGSRYDGQIAVFGQDFQRKLANQRQLLAGIGAVGCEFLKHWATMGLGSGSEGHIHICDLGVVRKSNLNSHVLFRPEDLGASKAERAVHAIKHLNADVKVTAYNEGIHGGGEHKLGFESCHMRFPHRPHRLIRRGILHKAGRRLRSAGQSTCTVLHRLAMPTLPDTAHRRTDGWYTGQHICSRPTPHGIVCLGSAKGRTTRDR